MVPNGSRSTPLDSSVPVDFSRSPDNHSESFREHGDPIHLVEGRLEETRGQDEAIPDMVTKGHLAHPLTSRCLVPERSEDLLQDDLPFRGKVMPRKLSLDQEREQITPFALHPSFEEILLLGAESLGAKEMLQKPDLRTHRHRRVEKVVQAAILTPSTGHLDPTPLRPNEATPVVIDRIRIFAAVHVKMLLVEPFMNDLGRNQHRQ